MANAAANEISATTGKKEVGAESNNTSQKVVSQELTQQAIRGSKEFRNGIPKNPECTYEYQDLCKFFYHVTEKRNEICEALIRAQENLNIEEKEDGSNGLGDTGNNHSSIDEEEIHLIHLGRQVEQVQRLLRVEKAIREGKYKNICKKCGEPIPLKRLMFVPETKHCVRCAM